MTFTTLFPTSGDERRAELQRIKEEFPDYLGDDAKAKDFDGTKLAEFARSAFGALLRKTISDADVGVPDPSKKRSLHQVCFFKYRDGAPMITIGWIVIEEGDRATFDACKFEALPFVRISNEPFKISIPLVTRLEIREMEKRLPNLTGATDLDWIPAAQRRNYNQVYRYLPHYSVVEQM